MPAAPPSHRSASGALLVLTAALLWGTIGPAQVLVGGAVGPAALAGWRQLVGAVALGAAATGDAGAWRRLRGRPVWILIVLAGVTGAAYQVTFLTSVSLTGAAVGTVVAVATVPVFAGAAARLVEGQRLTPGWMLGSGVAIAGCAMLLLPGAGSRLTLSGMAAGVLAGALFAAYTLVARLLAAATTATEAATGVSMLIGALLLTPAMLTGGAPSDVRTVALIGWLGVVTTAVAYALYARGLRHVTANVAGTLSLAELLGAAVLSTAFLGERLTVTEWVACAVILAGLLLAVPGRSTAPGEEPPGRSWSPAVGMVPMPLGITVCPASVGVAIRPGPPRPVGVAIRPGPPRPVWHGGFPPPRTVELPLIRPRHRPDRPWRNRAGGDGPP